MRKVKVTLKCDCGLELQHKDSPPGVYLVVGCEAHYDGLPKKERGELVIKNYKWAVSGPQYSMDWKESNPLVVVDCGKPSEWTFPVNENEPSRKYCLVPVP